MVLFTLKAPKKASIVERFIRTLKSRIERYFTENNTFKWIDILPKLSEAINNTVNRSIGMAPNEVNFENRKKVFRMLYGSRTPPIDCKYAVGDIVRIPLRKNIFDKGYKPSWSKELYTIKRVKNDGNVCYYQVEDAEGQSKEGFFYDQEINSVARNEVSSAQ